jgi:endonuclease YncB( thermonuclease family)
MKVAPIIAFLVLLSFSAAADSIVGRASVIDADTLEIHGERIRILDVDAPEARQPCVKPSGDEWRCGQEASLALSDWIGTQTVRCGGDKLDAYGRRLARCTVGNADVAEWLAASGWAVPYRDCKCEVVREAAGRAKASQLGIWSSSFMMPWDWRRKDSQQDEPSRSWGDDIRVGAAELGERMPYLLDGLLVVLGAALGIVGYMLFKTVRGRRHSRANVFSLPRRRSTFRSLAVRTGPALLLLAAGAAVVWWPEERFSPAITGFSSETMGCVIKGNISASGERIYHVPGNRYYNETHINESRGERWFCSEKEAVAAGWRPAKV